MTEGGHVAIEEGIEALVAVGWITAGFPSIDTR
jgi:hypothetical protein